MELGISVAVFLIAAALLIIAIGIDIIEYRRYQRGARAVVALGAAMEQQFKLVVNHLERLGGETAELAKMANLQQQQHIFLNSVVQVHSEVLNLRELPKAYKLHGELLQESE